MVFYEEFEYTSYGEWIPLGLTKEDKDIVRSKEAERYLFPIFSKNIVSLSKELFEVYKYCYRSSLHVFWN